MWNHVTAEVIDSVAIYLELQPDKCETFPYVISADEKQEGVHFNSLIHFEHCLITRPQKDNFNFALCLGPLPQAQQTAEAEVEAAGEVINTFPWNDIW